jgi:4-aminobutyrate aminotransferase/(S)-3-amino-2-methylpropionate transaminase
MISSLSNRNLGPTRHTVSSTRKYPDFSKTSRRIYTNILRSWLGDPARAILFRAILAEIENKNLVENTAETGAYLYAGLERLAAKFPKQIKNLRGKGQGTFIAWDSPQRDEVLKKAKTIGINIGGSGAEAVRLRPMLIFQKKHADILLEGLEKILAA